MKLVITSDFLFFNNKVQFAVCDVVLVINVTRKNVLYYKNEKKKTTEEKEREEEKEIKTIVARVLSKSKIRYTQISCRIIDLLYKSNYHTTRK